MSSRRSAITLSSATRKALSWRVTPMRDVEDERDARAVMFGSDTGQLQRHRLAPA
jgi:hypothetical protein